MKTFVFIILGLALAVSSIGCGKKQQSLEQMQEPMSMEVLSMINASTNAPAPSGQPAAAPGQTVPPAAVAPAAPGQLEPLPPAGPYKPTPQEIQTALKNAGFYSGNVDGKIGPMTKKAIEEFQKANSLTADGKVGNKTWAALSKHLSAPTQAPTTR